MGYCEQRFCDSALSTAESARTQTERRGVQHKGIHYDTGTTFRGLGYTISTRRANLILSEVRRELEIIRDDLHANAVRIVGSDLDRLTATTEVALGLGLEV
jgi:hypothetical protein